MPVPTPKRVFRLASPDGWLIDLPNLVSVSGASFNALEVDDNGTIWHRWEIAWESV